MHHPGVAKNQRLRWRFWNQPAPCLFQLPGYYLQYWINSIPKYISKYPNIPKRIGT